MIASQTSSSIAQIDRDINANMRALRSAALPSNKLTSAADWQAVRDANPVLNVRDHALYAERGRAQLHWDMAAERRRIAAAAAAERAARKKAIVRCSKCNSEVSV